MEGWKGRGEEGIRERVEGWRELGRCGREGSIKCGYVTKTKRIKEIGKTKYKRSREAKEGEERRVKLR